MISPDAKRLRFSVITVCYNAAATIEKTLASVLAQADSSFEYIVVDGGSTDGTLDILAKHPGRIDRLVSEKDKGIFDAMNKGVRIATGDVVYFLNADDSFVDAHVLRDIASEFEANDHRSLVFGNVRFENGPEGLIYQAQPFHDYSIREFLNNSFCHQALFARRTLFEDVGPFSRDLRYSADYEWVIRVFKFEPKGFHYVNRLIANYYYQGRSFTQAAVTRREVRGFYFKYFRNLDMAWYFFRYVLARGMKKKLMRESW